MFFFKQKTAYEMRISDWSSGVCSSDLPLDQARQGQRRTGVVRQGHGLQGSFLLRENLAHREQARLLESSQACVSLVDCDDRRRHVTRDLQTIIGEQQQLFDRGEFKMRPAAGELFLQLANRSEEHTSELQSLMRTSSAVF